ncbi:hypothetical protein [Streptomyces sp. NPDC047976]|uniref:hypothetical protein n=1 Tax=Streptomyces sp. NPDC047976 TaxID=3155746 RepID=UPI003440C664
MNIGRRKVLRRKVFVVLSSLFTVLLGAFALGAWASMVASGTDADALEVMAACLGGIAFIRRITGSRIILRQSVVSVVNPVFTYDIPSRSVARVEIDSGGNLIISTTQGLKVEAFGFAGSITDHFVGSAGRAASQIQEWIAERRDMSLAPHAVRRYTRAWVADGCIAGMLFCLAIALIGG